MLSNEDTHLDPDALRARLRNKRFGTPLFAFDTIGSTNEVCWRLALEGHPEGTLVLAETQRRGRGRRGRTWHSARGLGLWFSVLLRPRGHARYSWLLPLVMSLPVAMAVRELYSLDARVKWPNDVLVHRRKLAGVLVEGSVSSQRFDQAVVGIGVNVNQRDTHFPPALHGKVTSVRLELGEPVDRSELLVHILDKMERVYSQVIRDERPVLEQWKALCAHAGKRVRVVGDFGQKEGVFADLGPDGSVLLQDEQGKTEAVFPDDLFMLED